jgi:peptidoglycan/LPS O-acetylase OafA/YrhL
LEKTINKIAYLDGIRGTAALLVLIHHFLLAFYQAFYTGAMDASNSGGVDLIITPTIFRKLQKCDARHIAG